MNGGEIPVHLVYDTDHETEAVVKEISKDTMLKKNPGLKTRGSRSRKFDTASGSTNGEHLEKTFDLENYEPNVADKDFEKSNGDPLLFSAPFNNLEVESRSIDDMTTEKGKVKRKIQKSFLSVC